jgi:hypothetical protein
MPPDYGDGEQPYPAIMRRREADISAEYERLSDMCDGAASAT